MKPTDVQTMNTATTPGSRLRSLIESGSRMVPGAFNALTARLAERAGFEVVYISGAAVSAGVAALPDIGLLTLPEVAEQTRYITAAVGLPVLVDADTGFGEPVNVARAVEMLEAAGAAAVQIEDQQLPKRCGHLPGKELVTQEQMVAKLQAAVAARRDPNLLVIGRTDARGVTGFADAVTRAQAYRAAGADLIFPEALESAQEFARFRREVPGPLVANQTEFGKSPLLPFDELESMGYVLVLYPVTLLRLAMKAVADGLEELRRARSQSQLIGRMQTRQQLYEVLGYSGTASKP